VAGQSQSEAIVFIPHTARSRRLKAASRQLVVFRL